MGRGHRNGPKKREGGGGMGGRMRGEKGGRKGGMAVTDDADGCLGGKGGK